MTDIQWARPEDSDVDVGGIISLQRLFDGCGGSDVEVVTAAAAAAAAGLQTANAAFWKIGFQLKERETKKGGEKKKWKYRSSRHKHEYEPYEGRKEGKKEKYRVKRVGQLFFRVGARVLWLIMFS